MYVDYSDSTAINGDEIPPLKQMQINANCIEPHLHRHFTLHVEHVSFQHILFAWYLQRIFSIDL